MVSHDEFIKELQDLLAAYQAASGDDREKVMQILKKYIPKDKAQQ